MRNKYHPLMYQYHGIIFLQILHFHFSELKILPIHYMFRTVGLQLVIHLFLLLLSSYSFLVAKKFQILYSLKIAKTI